MPTDNNSSDAGRYEVQAVSKAAAILGAFKTTVQLSQSEIAAAVGLPKATVYRLAATLQQAGLLAKDSQDNYRLGSELVALARQVLNRGLPSVARPYMLELSNRFGHSVNLGIRSHYDVLFIEVLESRHNFRTTSAVGAREPLHATAAGKAILAELPQGELDEFVRIHGLPALTPNTITSRARLDEELAKVHDRGYAFDAGECVLGAHCVAAVAHASTDIAGAISVTAASGHLPAEDFDIVGKAVREAADGVTAELGGPSAQSAPSAAQPSLRLVKRQR
jgi:IclR family acetate operon transcriptional repressor